MRTSVSLSEDNSEIIKFLKERRLSLGLTQQEVAKKANIDVRQYWRLENGERIVIKSFIYFFAKVIRALELTISVELIEK